MALIFKGKPNGKNYRKYCSFENGSVYKESKAQIIQEVQETMSLFGLNRVQLAKRLQVQASAVTQSLNPESGIQWTTVVRMADVMGCDVEVNFIRRPMQHVQQKTQMMVEVGG